MKFPELPASLSVSTSVGTLGFGCRFDFGFDDFAIGPDADDRRAFRRTFDGDVVFGGFGKDDDEAFFELNGGDGWL